jgi:hypothetical protein
LPGPWDFIHDRKPKSLRDHLIDEFAGRLSADLKGWPLPISELDPALGAKWAHLLAPESARPSPIVFEQSFRLARWELERQWDALDEYMRNQRWLEAGIPPAEKQTLLFVSAWLVEQLLALSESTEGRIDRGRLVECLDRTARLSSVG